MKITIPRSGFAQGALVLLLVAAFGALSVGIPLVIAQLTSPAGPSLGGEVVWIPVIALAWGIASLIGAYGVWRLKPWAAWVVAGVQGLVAVSLFAAWVGGARDWSVLLVGAIAAGAVIFVLLDARRVHRT